MDVLMKGMMLVLSTLVRNQWEENLIPSSATVISLQKGKPM